VKSGGRVDLILLCYFGAQDLWMCENQSKQLLFKNGDVTDWSIAIRSCFAMIGIAQSNIFGWFRNGLNLSPFHRHSY